MREGTILDLIEAIQISKVGKIRCQDCDERYYNCKCEWCPDCKLDRCLCDWNITITSDKNDVRKVAWGFIKSFYNKYELMKTRKMLMFNVILNFKRGKLLEEELKSIAKLVDFPDNNNEDDQFLLRFLRK